MGLLTLPDELLNAVVNELQLVHATADGRDLVKYQRRQTNRVKKDVARLAQTCKRLQDITKPHLTRLPIERLDWLSLRKATEPLIPSTATAAKVCDMAIIVALRNADVGGLVALSLVNTEPISLDADETESIPFAGHFASHLSTCRVLETLVVDSLQMQRNGPKKLLETVAVIRTLKHLTLNNLMELHGSDYGYEEFGEGFEYSDGGTYYPTFAHSATFSIKWTAPLTRLEIRTMDYVSVLQFASLLHQFAPTLQIAILAVTKTGISNGPDFGSRDRAIPSSSKLKSLWRLDLSLPDLPKESHYSNIYKGALDTLLDLWSTAPNLTCLDCATCSAEKPAQLKRLSDLQSKSKLEYARLRLKTWKGQKGAGWTEEEMQEIVIGR